MTGLHQDSEKIFNGVTTKSQVWMSRTTACYCLL